MASFEVESSSYANTPRYRAESLLMLETLDEGYHRDSSDDSPLPLASVVRSASLDVDPEVAAAYAESFPSARQQTPRKPKRRLYYLDWLRVVSIYLVVFYHGVLELGDQFGTTCGLFGMKTSDECARFKQYQAASLQLGMPMFFHVSGRAQALSPPKNCLRDIRQRAVRLLVPFAVCWPVLIPYYMYATSWNRNTGQAPQHLFPWFIWWFGGGIVTEPPHLAWLWFLPALFVTSALHMPLFCYVERHDPRHAAAAAGGWCVILFALWGSERGRDFFGPSLILSIVGFPAAFAVASHYAPTAPLERWSAKRWYAKEGLTVAFFASLVGIAWGFQYRHPWSDFRNCVPGFLMYTGFYAHGYLLQRYEQPYEDAAGSRPRVYAGALRVVMMFLIFLTVTLAVPFRGVGEFHFYPVYSRDDPYSAFTHVAGTMAYIYVLVSYFRTHLDHEIHPWLHSHASTSTLVVYLFHCIFSTPLGMAARGGFVSGPGDIAPMWWRLTAPLLIFSASCAGPLGIYYLLLRFPKVGRLLGI